MYLDELLRRLAENGQPPETVEVLVDNGDEDTYTLAHVFDHGTHIVLVGDNLPNAL